MVEITDSVPLANADFDVTLPLPLLNPNTASFDMENGDAFALTNTRHTKKRQDLVFEFSRDPALLHQYFELYKRECRVVPALQEAENYYNSKGHILIVRYGNMCVGGGRLSVKTPRQPKPLPIEIGDFRLENFMPSLKHTQKRYGEFSRLVLLPEFRDGDITLKMWHHFYRKCVALNLDVVFAAAPLPNVRAYRKNCKLIGVKEMKIHMDIPLPPYPTYESVTDYLLSMVVDKDLMKNYEPAVYFGESAIEYREEA